MKRFRAKPFVSGIVSAAVVIGAVAWLGAQASQPGGDEQAVVQADRALVTALAAGNAAGVGPMLDAEFWWTNSAGATADKAATLKALPKPPLGDENGAKVVTRMYGQVGVLQSSIGKVHVLRVWGKRPAGWRLVVYHEVTQRDAAPAPGGPPTPTTNDCENPCKSVPYTPKDAAEKGILTSWGQLETAVTNHQADVWDPHFLDEFVLISSGGTEPTDKPARLTALRRPGIGPAPAGMAADPPAKFVHFGDSVLMLSQSRPYAGKPGHISRLWVNRGGMWRMAFSYQTTIQAAAALLPPKQP
jgi:hypothetical protein